MEHDSQNLNDLRIIPMKLNAKNRYRKTSACPKGLVSLGNRKYCRSNPREVKRT